MTIQKKGIFFLSSVCCLLLWTCSSQHPGRTVLDMTYALDDAAIFWPTAKPFSLTKVGWGTGAPARVFATFN